MKILIGLLGSFLILGIYSGRKSFFESVLSWKSLDETMTGGMRYFVSVFIFLIKLVVIASVLVIILESLNQ